MNKIFEQLLKARGVSEAFLRPKYEDLTNPMMLPDMEKAVGRLVEAKKNGEKVLVYGDYDVDGVTATMIMREALRLLGVAEIVTMLPDRFVDGYGMSERLVGRAKDEEVGLVVTVDCGSNNAEIVSELKNIGVDVIITDHHEILGELTKDAIAVVNPKRADFRENAGVAGGLVDLAGAGVAFMVAKALADIGEMPAGQEKWLLELAMIGTICDSMNLTRDNRIICKYGMVVLVKTRREGLKELMRVAGVKKITTEAIGFQIGPRLNAAGRMETAELALKLFLTNSKAEAVKIAAELDRLNAERRRQQQAAVAEVEKAGVGDAPVIVARGKWHEGIVGIIAGRLTERYKRPSFVLTETDEGILKGSGRSFGDFNLAMALAECQDVIASGGGHAAACGVKVLPEKYEEFREAINQYYKSLNLRSQERFLEAREDVSTTLIGEFNLDLMENMRMLEPFGNGNLEPVFLLEKMFVLDVSRMGAEGQHLRMMLRDRQGKTIKLVAFYAPEEWLDLRGGVEADVWVSLMENEWNGTRSVEGRILKLEMR